MTTPYLVIQFLIVNLLVVLSGLLNNIYVGCYCLGLKIRIVIHSPFF